MEGLKIETSRETGIDQLELESDIDLLLQSWKLSKVNSEVFHFFWFNNIFLYLHIFFVLAELTGMKDVKR